MGSRFSFLNRLNPKTEQELIEGGENSLKMLGNTQADADLAQQAELAGQTKGSSNLDTGGMQMQEPPVDTSYESGSPVAGSDASDVPPQHTIDPSTGSIKGVSSEPANQSYENGDPVAGQTDEAIVPRANMSPQEKTRLIEGEVLNSDRLKGPQQSIKPSAEDAMYGTPDPYSGADSEAYQQSMETLPDTIPTKSPVTKAQLIKLGLLGGGAAAAVALAPGGKGGGINRSPAVLPAGQADKVASLKDADVDDQAPGDDGLVKQQTAQTTGKTSGVTPIAPEVKGSKNSDPTTMPPPSINTVSGLQDAQDRENSAVLGNSLGRAADLIGAGIAGHGATPVAQAIFNSQIKDAGQITANFEKQVEQEKNDPKSQVSQDFRDYVKQFGMTLPATASASSAEKVMPYAFKKFEATEAQQARHEDMKYKYDSLTAQKQIAGAQRAQAASDKQSLEQEKAYTEANNKSLSYRSNPGVRQASADILSADKALALVKGKDPNTLTVQDLSLLTSEMAKVAQGGVPTEHGTSQLLPNNLQTKLAQAQNFLTSNPTDAQAGEYIKHNIHYLEDMKNVANQTINDFHNATIQGYKHRLTPDRYAELQQNFGLTPQDSTTQGTSQNTLNANKAPTQTSAAAPTQAPAPQMVHIRQKSTGKVKAFTPEQAAKYLQNPDFESVQ